MFPTFGRGRPEGDGGAALEEESPPVADTAGRPELGIADRLVVSGDAAHTSSTDRRRALPGHRRGRW